LRAICCRLFVARQPPGGTSVLSRNFIRQETIMSNVRLLFLVVLMAVTGQVSMVEAGDVSVELSACLASHYMWRALRLSDTAVFEPSATVDYKGLSANVWGNFDFDQGRFNEVDLTLAYSRTFSKVTVETGYIYYGVIDGEQSQELYAKADLDLFIAPSVGLYVDIDAGKGAYLEGGLSHTFVLPHDFSITVGGLAGVNAGDGYMGCDENGEEFTGFFNGQIYASASIPLSEKFSLEPMVVYAFPLNERARLSLESINYDGEAKTFFGGVTLIASF
jgi:hypothetical protein